MYRLSIFPLLLLFSLFLSSCYYSHTNRIDHWVPTDGTTIDSVQFRISHYYWKNYNFTTLNPLPLTTHPPCGKHPSDTLAANIDVVISDLSLFPTSTGDSVCIKIIGRNMQEGWVNEQTFLDNVVRTDPISEFIHFFSTSRTLIFCSFLILFIIGISLHILYRRPQELHTLFLHLLRHPFRTQSSELLSFYPTLCCITMSLTATLYGFIQQFAPETWVEFYFNPTINPFHPDIPHLICTFLLLVWSLLTISSALIIDAFRRHVMSDAILEITTVGLWCIILYLLFTLSVHIYIGYLLLPLSIYYFLHNYYQHYLQQIYRCGACGTPLSQLGICPKCGALNE